VKTSDWWVGYKDGIKGKVIVCAQIRGTKQVVLIAIDGGPISQLEARELPALKQQAQFDLEKKGINVELTSTSMTFSAFLQEHGRDNTDASKAQRTAAVDWLLVEWILALSAARCWPPADHPPGALRRDGLVWAHARPVPDSRC
jgi:hypothetical protein